MKYDQHVDMRPRGGMIDTPPNTPPGFALRLENMFYRNGSWITRAGARLLNTIAYTDVILGMWGLKSIGTGTVSLDTIIATRGTSVAQAHFALLQTGLGSFSPIPYNNIPGPPPGLTITHYPWRAGQVSAAVLYACRRTFPSSELYHVTVNQVTAAGITAPPTPTVVGAGAASALAAGTYPVSCRYVTSDGQYSPMAPIPQTATGGLVTITANQFRRWTLTASTHPRVTGIELMVGFDGGDAGSVYFAYLAANATATVDEDVIDEAYNLAKVGNFDLVVPPSNPEDVGIWDARQWLIVNSPQPTLWMSHIDAAGSSWETFNPQRALGLPAQGGRRYQAFRPWDRGRAALLTDNSCHFVQPGNGADFYNITDIDLEHGCVSASAVAIGAGILVYFDGRNVLATDGGPTRIISKGWVDEVLSHVPAPYATRAVIEYTPDDGGAFYISIPSADESTANDLVLCWDTKEWHDRSYFAGLYAPLAMNRIPSLTAQWNTAASFSNANRLIRLDSPVRRDEGPINIAQLFETGCIPIPEGYGSVSIARVHAGVRRRVDANVPDPGVPISITFSLRLNRATITTAVTATAPADTEYLHARAQNLRTPVANVSIIGVLDHPDLIEVFDLWAECVFYKRSERRT